MKYFSMNFKKEMNIENTSDKMKEITYKLKKSWNEKFVIFNMISGKKKNLCLISLILNTDLKAKNREIRETIFYAILVVEIYA